MVISLWDISNMKGTVLPCSDFFYFLSSLHSSHPEEKFHRCDLISPSQCRAFFPQLSLFLIQIQGYETILPKVSIDRSHPQEAKNSWVYWTFFMGSFLTTCGGWSGLDATCPPKPLCHISSVWQGRGSVMKGSWVKIKTGKSLSNYCHG